MSFPKLLWSVDFRPPTNGAYTSAGSPAKDAFLVKAANDYARMRKWFASN